MLIGPVFTREVVTSPRRPRLFIYRAVYAGALFGLMCTAWLIVAGVQIIGNLGDMARFGAMLFQVMAPLQLALMVFFSALMAASGVALEKDRKTLILLLMSRLTNSELVLGRLLASLLNVLVMLAAGLPVFMLAVLFGGISFPQVGRVFLVSLVTALAAGSLGSTIALWREKTFQTLAMTALAIVLWLGVWEAVAVVDGAWLGIASETWAAGFSPFRAVMSAVRPRLDASTFGNWISGGDLVYIVVAAAMILLLNGIAILRVRVWNPSREVRLKAPEEAEKSPTIWGVEHELTTVETGAKTKAEKSQAAAEVARQGHVDVRLPGGGKRSHRAVWDNPILWREMRTWAYGKKILIVHASYILLFAMTAAALYWSLENQPLTPQDEAGTTIPVAARPLAPLMVISLLIVTALAVTGITSERDGKSLDLLLATDLSPKEFILGKLGGVFWVTRLMVLLPMLLCLWLGWTGGIGVENLIYLLVGMVVMYLFAAMLGVHCGMMYSSSRTAISVSLGMIFFLFLGVATCILMMISFSGSFQVQLAPFLAFIMGGAIGMYIALGARNPSSAMAAACLLTPFATFFAITSFLLGSRELTVMLVVGGAYGFTTAAMFVPAVGEFDIAMGRTKEE